VNEKSYLPREDTYFLLRLIMSHPSSTALEIGSSTGFIIKNYATISSFLVGLEIDRESVETARKEIDSWWVELVNGDGKKLPFRQEAFDLVFFNPPYLPSKEIVDIAVDGGKGGIEVTLKFLREVKNVIKRSAKVILITSSLSDVKKLRNEISKNGFTFVDERRERLFFEELIGFVLLNQV
jgi:release factor glutamine methyltransferase